MLTFLQRIAVTILLVSFFAVAEVSSGETSGPVYQRERSGDSGRRCAPVGAAHGMNRHYYSNAGFRSTQVYGSWYQRPHPYHFDYYRWRYSQVPLEPPCPCQASAKATGQF